MRGLLSDNIASNLSGVRQALEWGALARGAAGELTYGSIFLLMRRIWGATSSTICTCGGVIQLHRIHLYHEDRYATLLFSDEFQVKATSLEGNVWYQSPFAHEEGRGSLEE